MESPTGISDLAEDLFETSQSIGQQAVTDVGEQAHSLCAGGPFRDGAILCLRSAGFGGTVSISWSDALCHSRGVADALARVGSARPDRAEERMAPRRSQNTLPRRRLTLA